MGEPKTKQIKQVVLIADDSSTVRKFVSFSLGAQGVEVITAVDGMDALKKVSRIPKLDLIIVDLKMPNMDGFEFIRNIRRSEVHGKVPVIILSSEGSEESIKWGEEAGADAYVEKPFDAKKFQSQVSRFLSVAAGSGQEK